MSPILTESRAWLESRYRVAELPLPAFRWVQRGDALGQAEGSSDALVLEDPELRLFLLLLDLDGISAQTMVAQVQADLQTAWALRSACLPGPGPGLPGGASAWRVAVHWLGSAPQTSAWRAAILRARQEGRLLEEIQVDATFSEPGEALDRCLEPGGFPSLLLATRQAFRMDAQAMDLWSSADRRVREAVADLEEAFPHSRERGIARELLALAQTQALDGSGPAPGPARRMSSLTVQNVRGVRNLTLEPWPGRRAVQAWVLQGPNGSGKSSLAEAVSLKAFGSSRGLCAYLKDSDVARARNGANYLAQYVTPLGGGEARCGLEGDPAALELAPDLERALEALTESEGALAAQSSAAGFLGTPGDELGARMAKSFSALAIRLEAHVEAGRKAAGELRTALARKHGINTTTRLLATFQEKIARSLLTPALAPLPPLSGAFLACRAALPGAAGQRAGALSAAWGTQLSVDRAVEGLLRVKSLGAAEVDGALLPFFVAQEALLEELQDCLTAFRSSVAGLPFPAQGLADQASRWADWLLRDPAPAVAAPLAQPTSGELPGLLGERAALAEEGRRTRPSHDHLEQALAFIRQHWQDRHPQDCPTCGSHLPASIEATVAALLAAAENQLAAQREAYALLTRRIKELENRPADPSPQACPVPPEAQRQIQSAVASLLGPAASAEALLRASATRSALERLLTYAEAPPALDLPRVEAEPAAAACSASILAAWREAECALAEPEAWEAVAKELTRRLAQVVSAHLPATLEGLWREIAACLSPAPWLLPAPPRFQARTLRGANRVEVVMETPGGERLARHLLNDAQRDTLGLAWTFCQHLARARFRHAWMLLDDPAQTMDQPAFRALCRFLATLLGLYEAAGSPFTLLLLLNKEERAMEAARETGQGLILLGWTAGGCRDQAHQSVRRPRPEPAARGPVRTDRDLSQLIWYSQKAKSRRHRWHRSDPRHHAHPFCTG